MVFIEARTQELDHRYPELTEEIQNWIHQLHDYPATLSCTEKPVIAKTLIEVDSAVITDTPPNGNFIFPNLHILPVVRHNDRTFIMVPGYTLTQALSKKCDDVQVKFSYPFPLIPQLEGRFKITTSCRLHGNLEVCDPWIHSGLQAWAAVTTAATHARSYH